jgi:gliding motility-associated-like protein
VESKAGNSSWSNEISIHFNHELQIPNVFTPNGDAFNEVFEICKLDLFPGNEFRVYNRWGKTIYYKKGYRGEWDGNDAAPGVYYYSLRLKSHGRHCRGWIQVLRKATVTGEK